MRILLASDHYPPFIGGVQRQTRAMALELRARGHDVGVLTVWQDHLSATEDRDGFPVWRLRQLRSAPLVARLGTPVRRHQPPFPDPVTCYGVRRVVRSFRPDVVHSSGWFSFSCAAALLGSDVPLVASAREYGLSCPNASMLHKGSPCSGPGPVKCLSCSHWYYGEPRGVVAYAGVKLSGPVLRRRMQALHSVSRYVEHVAERDFLRGRRPDLLREVVPSFRLPPEGSPDPAFLDRLPREPYILFVGALRRVKGVGVLLRAYRDLPEPRPPLVLLGTFEEDTPPIPQDVLAPGPADYPTVLEAWSRSLFGVMPSLWPEPFGSVVHEAMSRGKAVIGTTPGGHADMIEDGRSGLLVPPDDHEALRRAMERLVSDATLREALAVEALARADAFTAAASIPRFEALYEHAISDARPTSA